MANLKPRLVMTATLRLQTEANKVGYPLLVKAIMGGGGKGMKLARSSREVKEAVESAQREAAASFGDPRVLLERFIEIPRHIEVQVRLYVNDECAPK